MATPSGVVLSLIYANFHIPNERCEDDDVELLKWLFWCKIPVHVTVTVVLVIFYLVFLFAGWLAVKFMEDLMKEFGAINHR